MSEIEEKIRKEETEMRERHRKTKERDKAKRDLANTKAIEDSKPVETEESEEEKVTRVYIYCGDRDISDEVELKNGKANPFGWSTADIYWTDSTIPNAPAIKIGHHYCGDFELDKGFSHKKVEE